MEKAIYKITNKINGKIYIGQSIHPEKRFVTHCHKNKKHKSLISDAIQKYGKENFILEIIGWFKDYNEKEKYYIQYYRSLAPYGYNIAEGGENPPIGRGENNSFAKISNETSKKIKQDLLDWKIPRKQIVTKYHITYDILRHINDGSSWYDNSLKYPLRPTEQEINDWRAEQVIDMLKNTTLTQKEIGKRVGWNRSAVTMINIGKNHHQDNIKYPIRK